MSSAEEASPPPKGTHNDESSVTPAIDDPDENTIRVMVSTDNHLGYCDGDTVRGIDSFAALEEVLWLARHYQADMVLLAGDLFHQNKPSRGTLHKTMDLFRRYCMGDNPIQIQILSDQKQNFRRGSVNYEDANYSVDLPVFSIHGNHDDPTREAGSSDLFCALDLLDVANLVNYFGRQDKIDQVQISPLLMKKGDTHLALYGLGSMRDERLHRMWRSQKLKFLRPENHDEMEWFNLFALHQNRDFGRGTKNCIQETMIPEWMDLVCWGHEHECCIEPRESVVGTFRITQPGSSVATSLSAGEAEPKHIGILDIRGTNYRLVPIPLTQVRSFTRGELNLADVRGLDPDGVNVNKEVTEILDDRVRVLIHDAREQVKENLQNAKENGNVLAGMEQLPLKYTLQQPDSVLVRLSVDHSGFSVLNNQRFGAKFVGDVANPTDILLYSRKKSEVRKGQGSSKKLNNLDPIEPDQLQTMRIEDLIIGQLESAEQKMEVFDEKRISGALDAYVEKQEAQAIPETLETLLSKQQKRLIKGGGRPGDASKEDEPVKGRKRGRTTTASKDKDESIDESGEDKDVAMEHNESPVVRKKRAARAPPARSTSRARSRKVVEPSDSEELSEGEAPPPKKKSTRATRTRKGAAVAKYTADSSDENDEIEVVKPPPKRTSRAASSRATAASKRKARLTMSDSEEDDKIESFDEPPVKKRGKVAAATRGKASRMSTDNSLSQSQLSFAPVKRNTRRAVSTRKKYTDDDSGDEEFTPTRSHDMEEGWGTAKTDTYE